MEAEKSVKMGRDQTAEGLGMNKGREFRRLLKRHRIHLLMLLPPILFFFLFYYWPMYGIIIAFKDFNIMEGILRSPWAGLKWFEKAFGDPYFYTVLKNTLVISMLKFVTGFPAPLIFALLLNELRMRRLKKVVQTISYLPYFISWVVLGGIFLSFFSNNGPVNGLLQAMGMESRLFMADKSAFLGILIGTDIWKNCGWGSIIYLAALSSVDEEMLEAAVMDGAGRFQKNIFIIIPTLIPVIIINLILSMSGILNAGFDQIFNMYNAAVMDVADIIDTYVYRLGLRNAMYSYSAAVGLFKSAVCMILMILTNYFTKVITGEKDSGLW